MGRWMEVVREQPLQGQRGHTPDYKRLIVGETAPHPLLWAARAIQAGRRATSDSLDEFPLLARAQPCSGSYVDEDLWLAPDDVARLLDEFLRLRRVCRQEDALPGLNGRLVAAAWRRDMPAAEFEQWLDGIEALLWKAVEGDYWVRLML